MPAPVQTVWLGGLTGPRLMQVCHFAALGLWVLGPWTPSRGPQHRVCGCWVHGLRLGDPSTMSEGAGSMDPI